MVSFSSSHPLNCSDYWSSPINHYSVQRNIAGGKNDRTEAALLQAHPEKAGFFGKNNPAGKNIRQQEKRKTMSETDWLCKRSPRHESTGAEQGWTLLRTEPVGIHHSLIRLPEVGANSMARKACNTHKCLWSLLALFLRLNRWRKHLCLRDLSLTEVTRRQTDNHKVQVVWSTCEGHRIQSWTDRDGFLEEAIFTRRTKGCFVVS